MPKMVAVGCVALAAALVFGACGVQSAVEDTQAKLAAAQKYARAKQGIEKALPAVTKAVMSEVAKAMASAPAPYVAAAANSGTVDATFANAATLGGTVSATGTVAWTSSVSGEITTLQETFDIKITWTNLALPTDDGTAKSSGNETMKGTITVTSTVSGASVTVDMAGTMNLAGSFSLDGENHAFDLAYTLTETGATYVGKIDGQATQGTLAYTSGDSNATNNNNNNNTAGLLGCSNTNVCVYYSGSYYTDQMISAYCQNGSTRVASCPTGQQGKCTSQSGTTYEQITYYYGGDLASQQNGCNTMGGVWQ